LNLAVSVSGYYAWRKRTRESFGPERLQKHLDFTACGSVFIA
jgi:hypothetical protein